MAAHLNEHYTTIVGTCAAFLKVLTCVTRARLLRKMHIGALQDRGRGEGRQRRNCTWKVSASRQLSVLVVVVVVGVGAPNFLREQIARLSFSDGRVFFPSFLYIVYYIRYHFYSNIGTLMYIWQLTTPDSI